MITILLTGYTPIQNNKLKKNFTLYLEEDLSFKTDLQGLPGFLRAGVVSLSPSLPEYSAILPNQLPSLPD